MKNYMYDSTEKLWSVLQRQKIMPSRCSFREFPGVPAYRTGLLQIKSCQKIDGVIQAWTDGINTLRKL